MSDEVMASAWRRMTVGGASGVAVAIAADARTLAATAVKISFGMDTLLRSRQVEIRTTTNAASICESGEESATRLQ
jgi:hypothetical protein